MIMKVMEYIFGRCIDGTDSLNQTKFVYRWDLFLLTSVQLEVSYRTNLKSHFESGLKKQRPCRCIHWIYCCIYCCSSWGLLFDFELKVPDPKTQLRKNAQIGHETGDLFVFLSEISFKNQSFFFSGVRRRKWAYLRRPRKVFYLWGGFHNRFLLKFLEVPNWSILFFARVNSFWLVPMFFDRCQCGRKTKQEVAV